MILMKTSVQGLSRFRFELMRKEKLFCYLMVAAAIIDFALCALPLASAYSGGSESYTIVIHGYNLIEFSAWGVIPLLAPLIVPVLLFGHQSKPTQELSLATLFCVTWCAMFTA